MPSGTEEASWLRFLAQSTRRDPVLIANTVPERPWKEKDGEVMKGQMTFSQFLPRFNQSTRGYCISINLTILQSQFTVALHGGTERWLQDFKTWHFLAFGCIRLIFQGFWLHVQLLRVFGPRLLDRHGATCANYAKYTAEICWNEKISFKSLNSRRLWRSHDDANSHGNSPEWMVTSARKQLFAVHMEIDPACVGHFRPPQCPPVKMTDVHHLSSGLRGCNAWQSLDCSAAGSALVLHSAPKFLMIRPSVLLWVPQSDTTQHTRSLYVSVSILYLYVVCSFECTECTKPACFEADALISGFRYQMCVLLRGSQKSICNGSQSSNFWADPLKQRCRHGRLWNFANWALRGGGQGPRLDTSWYFWLK